MEKKVKLKITVDKAKAAERVKKILPILKKTYPGAKTALNYANPLELLIATILSAQCTDVRVNMVTKELYKKYKSAADWANADIKQIESDIKSTGFYRNKTQSIKKSCTELATHFGGKVPDNMDDLVKLPGVGRKTANVVLGGSFGKVEGIVVDTHVKRLSKRLKLSRETNPEKIEQDLMKLIQKKDWIVTGNLLIRHGRKICSARKPKCIECTINYLCPSAE